MPVHRFVVQVNSLTEELEQSRGGIRDQLKEKDAKINSLVEELGNSQAMLNDKVAELAEVNHQNCVTWISLTLPATSTCSSCLCALRTLHSKFLHEDKVAVCTGCVICTGTKQL